MKNWSPPPEADELIPHRLPMCLIDRLITETPIIEKILKNLQLWQTAHPGKPLPNRFQIPVSEISAQTHETGSFVRRPDQPKTGTQCAEFDAQKCVNTKHTYYLLLWQ